MSRAKKPAARASKRNTQGAGAKRNTASSLPRVDFAAPVVPMKASAQLDAFPTSDNARARQSRHRKAVVAVRLSGDTIARLDAEAARATKAGDTRYRRSYYGYDSKVTRAEVIGKAIEAWLKAGAS